MKRLAVAGVTALRFSAMASDVSAPVVAIHYSIQESDVDKLSETIALPVERSLHQLARISTIKAAISHGVIDVEVEFEGGATVQDGAAVTSQIEKLELDNNKAILSRSIELRQPRLRPEPI